MEFKKNMINGGALHFYSPTRRAAQSVSHTSKPHPITARINKNKRTVNRNAFYTTTTGNLHGGSVGQCG